MVDRDRIANQADDRERKKTLAGTAKADPGHARNKSRAGHEPGHGGEGFSKGYGGGGGDGVSSPAGPEDTSKKAT